MVGLAQVHLAKMWEWYLVKDDNKQGEQFLKPFLTLFPATYKQKILDGGQTWKVALHRVHKNGI